MTPEWPRLYGFAPMDDERLDDDQVQRLIAAAECKWCQEARRLSGDSSMRCIKHDGRVWVTFHSEEGGPAVGGQWVETLPFLRLEPQAMPCPHCAEAQRLVGPLVRCANHVDLVGRIGHPSSAGDGTGDGPW